MRVQHVVTRYAPPLMLLCTLTMDKLEGEESPIFDRMFCMDGNNSLKRVRNSGGRELADMRIFEDHDYLIPRVYVDMFANKVKARQEPRKPDLPSEDDQSPEENAEHAEGDPTDGAPMLGSCASHWKAAAAEEKKKMWAIYDESGIFASACRHSLILWIVDMVRSGELYVVNTD